MKKLFKLIFLFSVLTSVSSCKKDFLEKTPLDKFPDGAVWSDPALITTFVNNIYLGVPYPFTTLMLSSTVDESMAVWDWESSNVTKSMVTPSYLGIFDNSFWTGSMRDQTWAKMYLNIRACNLFLEKIDAAPFDDKKKQDQLKGEVLFLRAFFYHQLVAQYGGVPIITKAYGLSDEFAVPRDTYEKCIKFISDECDKATALLPLTGDKARATKGAALSLKSRTLLYAASDLYNSNGSWATGYANKDLIGYTGGDRTARWQAAKDAAKAVINLAIYGLYGGESPASPQAATQNYSNIFLTKGNEEDIFIQFWDVTHDGAW
ncbi:MAG TPA: RagB/SusD family nutrient uptake outer membrane protein, partial [Chitinophagaceae bacterium]|nr:RagB/SusD family nutrient uptake outer membrane protein [Chitinophagaceae bacterium]